MVFSSTEFLFLFLPIVLIGYYNPFFKSRQFRNIWLLLASIGFYAWGEPLFVFVMLFSIVLNWLFGLRVGATAGKTKKAWLIAALVWNVGLFFVFKYLGFAAQNVGWLLHKDFSDIGFALPIGISFFTFQILSYVLDVYYGKAKVQPNVLYVGLYVSMFPQLIAGPIVRYETVAEEINSRTETREDIAEGMIRFVYGLGKKALIANYAGQLADIIFELGAWSVSTAWLGALYYALQIYFDFSGYSDMAIGLGWMFGFHFKENFNYPYIARSVTDFWRRWHISLSTWFRDYVYIPLGGNRVGKPRWIFNLFVVWALTGLWHGANWTFVLWGLFYFVLLLLEKLTGFAEKLGAFSHVYTLVMVLIAWVLFRSESVSAAGTYLASMFGFGATGLVDALAGFYLATGKWILLAGVGLSIPVFPWLKKKLEASHPALWAGMEAALLVGIFVLSLIVTISASYKPFIYFNF